MKKNILIIVLLSISTFSMVFAYFKADEAEKYAQMAILAQQEAEKQYEETVRQQELAITWAAEARKQEQLALDLAASLTECQTK